ncbi:MAG: endonuclease III domain-containing protein [Candidatus Omnitrophica bacterium]|nr:endonuclease III domain-containing protein [Candidatus Omnitrophota bacterium]
MDRKTKTILVQIYQKLYKKFGPQRWWPAQTQFEVIVGAILTQNTNWGNVEKAIHRLKAAGVLSARVLRDISVTKLAALIKPAGYFNVKAQRLKNFMRFLFDEYDGNLKTLGGEELSHLRHKLLKVNGIGPETADSILLYALDKPVFVVDAYSKRFLYRHNLIDRNADYHQIQELFMGYFDHDTAMFNEYHALIVALGKNYCKPNPSCDRCPLNRTQYSLTFKCGSCHRAFLKGEKRIAEKSGFLCSECRV